MTAPADPTEPAERADRAGYLPTPLNRLVGRGRETVALRAMLRDDGVRLLTLTGPGGVGKTRVAVEAGRSLSAAFPDGVRFVALAPVAHADLVVAAIARAVGVRESGAQDLHEQITDSLREKRLLLLLDNVEHVVDAAPIVAALLSACPHLSVLATSRVRLRLSGEREFPIFPLPLPPLTAVSSDEVGDSEAVRLFLDRARSVQPDFTLTSDNAAAIAGICHRLDGLPLAIELAAVRVKVLPPDALLARLETRLPLLTGGGRDLPPRQRTMSDTIAWSYDLLGTAERALFWGLAVFARSCSLEAAECVTGTANEDAGMLGSSPAAPSVLDGVSALVDANLVRRIDEQDGEPRFETLETIREYALARLAASGEEEALRRRHAEWCLTLLERADPELWGPGQERWLRRLDAEHHNFIAALAWATQHGETDTALRLGTRLLRFWCLRVTHMADGLIWLERALERSHEATPVVAARAFVAAGALLKDQGHYARATVWLEAGLERCRATGERADEARALVNLGIVARFGGDYPRATRFLRDGFAVSTEIGHDIYAAYALDNLGMVALATGDYADAAERFDAALVATRGRGDAWGAAIAQYRFGMVERARGNLAQAATLFGEAIGQFSRHGDGVVLAESIQCLAGLGADRGRWSAAVRLLGQSDALRETLRFPMLPDWRADRESTLVRCRAALDSVAFDAAWTAGGALQVSEAASEASALAAELAGTRSTSTLSAGPDSAAAGDRLTARELEVLTMLAVGKSDREIGEALFIGTRTVQSHVAHLFAKLGVHARAEAAAMAVRRGLA